MLKITEIWPVIPETAVSCSFLEGEYTKKEECTC
jgi:hypothetical protein